MYEKYVNFGCKIILCVKCWCYCVFGFIDYGMVVWLYVCWVVKLLYCNYL